MKNLILTIILIFTGLLTFAQNETYVTVPVSSNAGIYAPDRPGFTANSYLIGNKLSAFEMGYSYKYYKLNDLVKSFNANYLYRYGFGKNIEGRFGIDLSDKTFNDTVDQSGISDLNIGLKIPFLRGSEYFPDMAFLGTVYFPVCDKTKDYIRTPKPVISANLTYQKSFNNLFLCANTGLFLDGFDNTKTRFNYSFMVGYVFNKFVPFIETYRDCTLSNNYHSCDLGLAYFITDNVEIDLSGGINYKNGFNDTFINFGLAKRIPENIFHKR